MNKFSNRHRSVALSEAKGLARLKIKSLNHLILICKLKICKLKII